jgi:hypothetical protein
VWERLRNDWFVSGDLRLSGGFMHWLVEVERLVISLCWLALMSCVAIVPEGLQALVTIVLFAHHYYVPFRCRTFCSTVHDQAERKCQKRDCRVYG